MPGSAAFNIVRGLHRSSGFTDAIQKHQRTLEAINKAARKQQGLLRGSGVFEAARKFDAAVAAIHRFRITDHTICSLALADADDATALEEFTARVLGLDRKYAHDVAVVLIEEEWRDEPDPKQYIKRKVNAERRNDSIFDSKPWLFPSDVSQSNRDHDQNALQPFRAVELSLDMARVIGPDPELADLVSMRLQNYSYQEARAVLRWSQKKLERVRKRLQRARSWMRLRFGLPH